MNYKKINHKPIILFISVLLIIVSGYVSLKNLTIYFSLNNQKVQIISVNNTVIPTDFVKPVVRPSRIMFGDYAGEIRKSNGRVDVDLTIERLKSANINTYAFLLWHNPEYDYEDFLLFLNAAKKVGIDVIAYLVSPQENCATVLPYKCDFVEWAKNLATLSLSHSNLKAWTIDDFLNRANEEFPGNYVANFVYEAHKINPNFAFYPIIYQRYFSFLESSSYINFIDGIIMPFFKYDTIDGQIKYDTINGQKSCHSISSVPLLQQDIDQFHSLYFNKGNENTFNNLIKIKYPAYTVSTVGDYAGITTKINNIKNLSRFSFDFNSDQNPTKGYHIAQLLVGENIIWEHDVADGSALKNSFNLSSFDSNSDLILRIYEKKSVGNYPISTSFFVSSENFVNTFEVKKQGLFDTEISSFPVRNLNLFVMIYSQPLYNCGDSTPEYVSKTTELALSNVASNKIQGTMLYVLDKKDISSGSKYDFVKNVYSKYQDPVVSLPPLSTPPPPPTPVTSPTPTPTPILRASDGICGSTLNSCTQGILRNTEDSFTQYLWMCLGSNNGFDASCSQTRYIPPVTTIPPVNTPSTYRPQPTIYKTGTTPNKDTYTINIPTSTIDITLPKPPSWLDVIKTLLNKIITNIIRGVKRTGEVVGI